MFLSWVIAQQHIDKNMNEVSETCKEENKDSRILEFQEDFCPTVQDISRAIATDQAQQQTPGVWAFLL